MEGLCKSFDGVMVLRDVCFCAGPGVSCIMGPSGAGKTTLLRIVLGLEKPDRGTISGLENCRFSAVFQEDRLLENESAQANLRFVLGAGFDLKEAQALLEELGLGSAGDKPVREWSGGMRRRLALARALLAPYDLLVLDEPFTGLDGENCRRAMEALQRRLAGRSALLATHEETAASFLGASIIRLGNESA